MLSNFCKDLAVQYVKTIVDRCRCGLCDKADGARMRFACGHSACVDCVAVAGDCPTCSPLMDPSSKQPLSDEPQTERVRHASELLTSFQDAFQIDVYQRQRISDRLKVEKELFPECIQAPSKYFNKRKSLNLSKKGKENKVSSYFPGENISSSKETVMNKSRNYVQAWLNKQNSTSSPSRSPFSNLKVNTYHSSTVKGQQKHNEVYTPIRKSKRKKSQLKQPLSTSTPQSSLEHYLRRVEKGTGNAWLNTKSALKRKLDTKEHGHTVQSKKHCDESGIVIDDSFTIEDTPDQVIDKDRLALLEVEHADHQASQSVVVIEDSQPREAVNSEEASTSIDDVGIISNRVPFYHKSYLYKTCNQCINKDNVNVTKPNVKDVCKRNCNVSITVENESFITTIQVVDCKQSNYDKKQSAAVQTDLQEPFLGFEKPVRKDETVTLISKIQEYLQSEAMFTEAGATQSDSQKTSCFNVVNIKQEVSKEDHHNEQLCGHGILTEIDGAGFQNKRRKAARGVTPDSNNSSDKENFDPNRMKKNGGKKKKKQINAKSKNL